MPHPKDLLIADFTYELPAEKVASYPLATRDGSKLLVNDKGVISETGFGNIAHHLPAGALMVFNNSKVIQSRLSFTKSTGGVIEIFVLEPCGEFGDISAAMKTEGRIRCNCLVGGAKKWKHGKLAIDLKSSGSWGHEPGQQGTFVMDQKNSGSWGHEPGQQRQKPGQNGSGSWVHEPGQVDHGEPMTLTAEMIEKKDDGFIIEFNWHPGVDFATMLELFGNTPIPPYLNRPSDETDRTRYQTIYAKEDGSVAAPTAGLHFTPTVMQSLQAKNIQTSFVTLHVGAGTFKPVKSERIEGHEMHAEFIDVEAGFIRELIEYPDVIPVGTTSMRTVESLYWMGVKAKLDPSIDLARIEIKQWETYDHLASHHISKKIALTALLEWMTARHMNRLIVRTQILIAPPYQPKIATSLVTNFHQPQSTLLLLIAALAGDAWKKMYQYALENNFRFLSYGDSCLIKW